MLRKAIVVGLLCPWLSLAVAQEADVVGRFGDTDVSVADLGRYIEAMPPADRAKLVKDPAQVTQMVRAYMVNRAVLASAHEAAFEQQTDVKARLDLAREALLAEMYLQSIAPTSDAYPSDAEVKAAYDANPSAFIAPRRYHLAQIFIAAGKDDKASPRLDEVAKKLAVKGADFAALAKAYSDAKTEAARGGDIGWFAEPQLLPDIRQAIAKLARGGVTAPIRIADGWHIMRLIDTQAPATTPTSFAEVKASLAEQMRKQRRVDDRKAVLEKIVGQKPITVNEMTLTKLTPFLK
jgi:parvulin-like peptidyl-prolyl isomerase